jgi:hypothetical protein
MSRTNVFRDDRLHVMSKKCSTCIYRPGNLMRLNPGRKDQMETEAVAEQGTIPCHKTLDGDMAICRGFFDTQKHNVGLLSAAERIGIVKEVDADDYV